MRWIPPPPRHGRFRCGWAAAAAAALIAAACDATTPLPLEPLAARSLIPLPATMTTIAGGFPLHCGATVGAPGDCPACLDAVAGFARAAGAALGCDRPLSGPGADDADIVAALAPGQATAESYTLAIGPDRVRITGADPAGVFYGIQTLGQLLPAEPEFAGSRWRLPAGHVADHPRYAVRGVMLDVARHFFTVAEVKRLLDAMAAYKLNRLHLHLTDDQGWRIEIASWPRLATVGGATEVGGGEGGYYTQDEYRSLVAYAAARHIEVVPEVDMPGHINAALVAYGELTCDGEPTAPYTGTEVGLSSLCVGKPAVDRFMRDVIAELAAMTPGDELHLGADEAYQTAPEDYAAFVSAAFAEVRRHGKRPVGWEEAGEAAPPGEWTVQHWLLPGRVPTAVAAGADVILSPFEHTYLSFVYEPGFEIGNTWAGFRGLEDAYGWDPDAHVPGLDPAAVRGVEAAVWSEHVTSYAEVQRTLFPRLLATAEVGWTPQARREFPAFRDRVGRHGAYLDRLGIAYYRAGDVDWQGP